MSKAFAFSSLIILAIVATGCYLYYPTDGRGVGGGGGGGKDISDGYIDSAIPDAKFLEYAKQKGFEAERLDYAAGGVNAKGDTCRRFMDIYYPSGTAKGIMVIFHGGGFDVGFADFKSQATKAMGIAERGYITISCEYRRGWTDAQFNGAERDVFNASAREYARLETSARMAFEDARTSIQFIRRKFGKSLPIYVEGTSAGGSIVLYLTVIDSQFRKAQGIEGGLCGYGGVSIDDSLEDTDVPLLLIGGILDTRVPFYEGWYFGANGKSEQGIGIGKIYEILSARNNPVCLIATCNAGHTFGAVEKDESLDIFFDLVEKHKSGTAQLPAEVWYEKNHNSGSRVQVENCQ